MSKALSLDLRVRVLAAVQAGASHREAAERFGVSAASVSRWRAREREAGDARPKALGGDRRSKRIEACHDAVMAALGPDKDATIEEVRQALGAQGLVFGFGTIQRFFVRHAITRKTYGPPRPQERLSRAPQNSLLQRIRRRKQASPPRWRYARSGPHKRLGDSAPSFAPGFPNAVRLSGPLFVTLPQTSLSPSAR